MKEDKSSVISLMPISIACEKPGIFPGTFRVPAARNFDAPGILVVGSSVHYVDVGETRPQLKVSVPSVEVARAIVEDFIDGQLAIEHGALPGITWIPNEIVTPTDIPTKYSGVLNGLKERHKLWYLALIKWADDEWQKYHIHASISDIARIAAHTLGLLDREWLVVPEKLPTKVCPACGTHVIESVVVCPQCRCVLDKGKYAILTFAGG